MSNRRGGLLRISASFLLIAGLAAMALACGGDDDERYIDRSAYHVLNVPSGNFLTEIRRLLPKGDAPFQAVHGDFALSREADGFDLTEALKSAGKSEGQIESIIKGYGDIRKILEAKARFNQRDDLFNLPQIPAGLPPEFDKYIRGLIAYHQDELEDAREEWRGLLDLPADQRKMRTVWAAFMMGKSFLEEDADEAEKWFQKTRDVAKQGFADRIGLASSSLGWEAKARLSAGDYVKAIDLYFEQFWTGDYWASASLRIAAQELLNSKDDEALDRAAQSDLARRVLTAYILADAGPHRGLTKQENLRVPRWLEAVERVAPAEMPGADRLAWAAYRTGQFDTAQRWVRRAKPDEPIAQWVQAKLHLRNGDPDAAARVLAELVNAFRAQNPSTSNSEELPKDFDRPSEVTTDGDSVSIEPLVAGDLAMFKLSRGQYIESMELLYRSHYLTNANYIAERVLRIDELKAYVDRHCPEKFGDVVPETWPWARSVRFILAQRLAREGNWDTAAPYFPSAIRKPFEDFVSAVRSGKNGKLTASVRAENYLLAARTLRANGNQFFGTFTGGRNGFLNSDREAGLAASQDEIERNAINVHLVGFKNPARYLAADYAWSAARFMPDERPETAAVLYEAGCWLKARDPNLADRFYKAIVNRCGTTPLGKAAASRRWFPDEIPKK